MVSCFSNRSGDGSFVDGAIGNLKLDEKEPEGFLPVAGSAGVLGVVTMPGLRRGARAGNAYSFDGS